jgi:hypothetical protein
MGLPVLKFFLRYQLWAPGNPQSAIVSGGARWLINLKDREPFTIADSRFTAKIAATGNTYGIGLSK